MEQLGSHWTDFHEIQYFSIFQKCVEKIQGSLKSDKDNGHFICKDQYRSLIVSRTDLLRMRHFAGKSCRETKNTFYVQYNFF